MLTSLVIFLGISVAGMALLDFYMGDGQKKWLNEKVLSTWNWLDEAKRVPLLDMLRSRKSQRILATVLALIGVGGACLPMYLAWRFDPDDAEASQADRIIVNSIDFAIWVAVATIPAWFGIKILAMILRSKTALQTFFRASIAFVLVLLPVLLAGRGRADGNDRHVDQGRSGRLACRIGRPGVATPPPGLRFIPLRQVPLSRLAAPDTCKMFRRLWRGMC